MDAPQADLTYSRALTLQQRALTNEDDLLKLARARALDPAVLEQYPPFFWSGEASSSRWDAYATRMAESTLRNYAAEASTGVAFLRNHDSRQDAIGQTLTGRFVGGQGNGVARMEADFYALATPETTGYIAKIRGGVVRDLSVGFYGGQWICSLCGRDMQQWFGPDSCPHLLGMTYTPRDEAGGQQGEPQIARATIEDAHLAEISGVYDGATPGAMIAKARMLAAEGQLDERRRELVEVRYRTHLPTPLRAVGGVTLPPAQHEERTMPDDPTTPAAPPSVAEPPQATPPAERAPETTTPPPDAPLSGLRALLTEANLPDADRPLEAVRALLSEVARLRPLADDGRAYRTDLVAEALSEGVRAFGAESFSEETYRAMLEAAPLGHIKRVRDDWARLAATQFAGGRATTDGAPEGVQQPTMRATASVPVPPAAYMG